MRADLEKFSFRFLEMENNNTAREKLHFPVKNLWKKNQDSEDIKYITALKYIFDQLQFCVPTDHKNFIYLILNVIFFNKSAK